MPDEQLIPSDFLTELFRLALYNAHVQEICISKLKATWLPTQAERDFFTELKYQVEVEAKKPSLGTLLLSARSNKNKDLFEYVSALRELEPGDPATVMKSLEDFIRQAMFIEMYDKAANSFNTNKKKQAYTEFLKGAQTLQEFSLTQNLFKTVFKEFPIRNANRIVEASKGSDVMPCGIDGIDAIFGGFQRKEYVLFLAGSKGSKSFCMTHMGVNYARRGYGVVHFQLEGTEKQCMARYDSAWLGSTYTEVRAGDITETKFKAYKNIINNLGKGEIFVYAPERYDAMSMPEIRRMVIDLQKKHQIDVIIIDYLDLVAPDGEKYGVHDERLKKQKTSRAHKTLAMETNTLVIGNTQSNSVESDLLNDSDFCLKRENLSEDKGTVQAVDFLITINRTLDERKDQIARLYVDAAREYKGDQVVTIKQNLGKSRFYSKTETIKAGFFTP